ncbi:MAG TPA: hypothetical protein DCE78_06370 [Bacteroidetes bacterium]|nr:hypothetical protein [Bacteroidota bacterium]
MKKLTTTSLFALLLLILVIPAQAQFSFGVSYEERPDAPEQGFGLQLEHSLLPFDFIASLRARLNFSYFSQDASLSVPLNSQPSVEFGRIQSVDYGGAILGGLKLGMISPYVGLGLGVDSWKFKLDDYENSYDNDTINYYGLLGASLSIFPVVHPYVEYRVSEYGSVEEVREQMDEGKGRFIIGVKFNF